MKTVVTICMIFAFTVTLVYSDQEKDIETLALEKIERNKIPRIIPVPMYPIQFPSRPLPGVKYPLYIPQ